MSTVSTAGTTASRSSIVTAAAILLAALGALDLLAAPIGMDAYGVSFTISCAAFAAVRIVAAMGVWHRRRWAAILGLVITTLDTVAFLPFITDDDSRGVQVIASAIVPIGVVTLIVLGISLARRAYR